MKLNQIQNITFAATVFSVWAIITSFLYSINQLISIQLETSGNLKVWLIALFVIFFLFFIITVISLELISAFYTLPKFQIESLKKLPFETICKKAAVLSLILIILIQVYSQLLT